MCVCVRALVYVLTNAHQNVLRVILHGFPGVFASVCTHSSIGAPLVCVSVVC